MLYFIQHIPIMAGLVKKCCTLCRILRSMRSFSRKQQLYVLQTRSFRPHKWRHFSSEEADRLHDLRMRHGAVRHMQQEPRNPYVLVQVDDFAGNRLRIANI